MVFVVVAWLIAVAVGAAAFIKRFGLRQFRVSFVGIAFLVLILGSVFGYEFLHIPAPIPITTDRGLLAGLVALFAFGALRGQQTIQDVVALDLVVVALLATIAFSAVTHDWSYSGNLPISRFLFFYMMPAALYLVVRNVSYHGTELHWILVAMLLFGVYLSAVGICEVKGISAAVFPRYILNSEITEFLGRARGPFLNPISNGIFMTTSVASALVLYWQSKDIKFKCLFVGAGILIIVGNVATLTRSVWLGLAIGGGIVVWATTNRRQRAALALGSALAGIVLVAVMGESLINFKRDKHVTRSQMAQSAELRPIFAAIAWDMFQDQPVFGHGFGQYNRSKLDYLQNPSSGLQLAKAKPYLQHNVFLSLLTELGAIGCGLLIVLIVRSLQIAIQLFRHPNASSIAKMYALVLIALLVSYTTNGMFHDTSIIPMANMLLFFFVALVVRQHQDLGLSNVVLKFQPQQNRNMAEPLTTATG